MTQKGERKLFAGVQSAQITAPDIRAEGKWREKVKMCGGVEKKNTRRSKVSGDPWMETVGRGCFNSAAFEAYATFQ